jgi:hypothetical protein
MFANLFEDKKSEEIEIAPDALSIDLLRAVYRDNSLPLTTRMRAAMACLKHEVPALLATAVVSEGSFAELLENRIRRFEEMKLVEAKPTINGNNVEPPKVDVKPPLAHTNDKRFRRL